MSQRIAIYILDADFDPQQLRASCPEFAEFSAPAWAPEQDAFASLCADAGIENYPLAALHALAHDATQKPISWLYVRPVALQLEATAIFMREQSQWRLSSDDAEALFATIKQHFAVEGLQLSYWNAQHWAVALDHDLHLHTPAPETLIGKNIDAVLRYDRGAPEWLRRFTEAQMLLANHPVNQARIAAELAPINALWFYGAGRVRTQACSYKAVYTDCSIGQGIAHAQHLPVIEEVKSNSLIVLARPRNHEALFSHCLSLLRDKKIAAIDFVLAHGQRSKLTKHNKLSWWQRLWH